MSNNYYKSSLIFAIFLHATLVLGLLIKFTSSHSIMLNSNGGFINAIAVNESNINNFSENKPIKIEKLKSNVDNKTKNDINDLQKNLLTEQLKELVELKQAKKEYKKAEADKQKKQMQKILQDQIKVEQKQLLEEQLEEKKKIDDIANNSKNEIKNALDSDKIGSVQSSGEFNEYAAKIKQAISAEWIVPDGVGENVFCKLLIKIAPGGMVLNITVIERSGNSEILENSAKNAINKASPLPVPQDINAFDKFREIKLNFNPSGVNDL